MLSKRTKKSILFGFLGGVVGFVIAVVLFFLSFVLLFGWWGAPEFLPTQIFIIGVIISFSILILSFVLKLKRFGILTSIVIFLMSYIATLITCRMPNFPVGAEEIPIFCITVLIMPFLVWIMFIIAGIKKGLSVVTKGDK